MYRLLAEKWHTNCFSQEHRHSGVLNNYPGENKPWHHPESLQCGSTPLLRVQSGFQINQETRPLSPKLSCYSCKPPERPVQRSFHFWLLPMINDFHLYVPAALAQVSTVRLSLLSLTSDGGVSSRVALGFSCQIIVNGEIHFSEGLRSERERDCGVSKVFRFLGSPPVY